MYCLTLRLKTHMGRNRLMLATDTPVMLFPRGDGGKSVARGFAHTFFGLLEMTADGP